MVKPVAQVLSVHTDGRISGLQRKQGEGVDLTTLGHASVQRSSEILWAEMEQGWYVRLLDPPYSQLPLTEILWAAVVGYEPSGNVGVIPSIEGYTLLFRHYEDAVRAEIVFLNAARTKGLLHTTTVVVSSSFSAAAP